MCADLPRRSAHRPTEGSEGFALAAVVFLLFAVGVAAATGYQIVRAEVWMAQYTGDAGKALAIAEAGLRRFSIDPQAGFGPGTTYAIDGGEAVVETRLVSSRHFPNTLHLVTSRGSFAGPRQADVPAVRVLRQYLMRRRAPVNAIAAVSSTGRIRMSNSGFQLNGEDAALAGDCAESGHDIHGAAAGSGFAGGPPHMYGGGRENLGSAGAVLDALGVDWPELLDGPVDFENAMPTFSFLSPDFFPVIRMDGNFTGRARHSGRGILIVEGGFQAGADFHWKGIILAGGVKDLDAPGFTLRGMLAVGLAGGGEELRLAQGEIQHDSCVIIEAGAPFTRLDPVRGSWFERR